MSVTGVYSGRSCFLSRNLPVSLWVSAAQGPARPASTSAAASCVGRCQTHWPSFQSYQWWPPGLTPLCCLDSVRLVQRLHKVQSVSDSMVHAPASCPILRDPWKPRQWVPVSTIFARALLHNLNAVGPHCPLISDRFSSPPYPILPLHPHLTHALLTLPLTSKHIHTTTHIYPLPPHTPPSLPNSPQETLGCRWLIGATTKVSAPRCSPTELFHRRCSHRTDL